MIVSSALRVPVPPTFISANVPIAFVSVGKVQGPSHAKYFTGCCRLFAGSCGLKISFMKSLTYNLYMTISVAANADLTNAITGIWTFCKKQCSEARVGLWPISSAERLVQEAKPIVSYRYRAWRRTLTVLFIRRNRYSTPLNIPSILE